MEILNFPTWDTTNRTWLVAIFPDKYPWNKKLHGPPLWQPTTKLITTPAADDANTTNTTNNKQTNKQPNNQTTKQTNNQTTKQPNKQTNKRTNEQTKMEHKNKRRSHLVRSKRQRYWRSNWSSKSQWIGLREDESNKSISWKQIKHYWRMLKVFQIYTIDNGQKKP